MKANQKYLKSDDDAVSPVIAVILMVAITVVLAATVYVWVSGFGSSTSSAQKSIALVSSGSLSNNNKNYTVASATPGMKYGDMNLTINGAPFGYNANFPTGTVVSGNAYCVMQGGSCIAANAVATTVVSAGDQIALLSTGGISGATLRILDSQANSVMLTLVVG